LTDEENQKTEKTRESDWRGQKGTEQLKQEEREQSRFKLRLIDYVNIVIHD